MASPKVHAVACHEEVAVLPHDRQPRAKRQRQNRRQLDARPGVCVGAQRCDPMRRLGRIAERFCRQIADITVAIELRPGPSAALVVDHEAFAVERLGLERRLGVRRAFQRRAAR